MITGEEGEGIMGRNRSKRNLLWKITISKDPYLESSQFISSSLLISFRRNLKILIIRRYNPE
jgi:hypothetical protein